MQPTPDVTASMALPHHWTFMVAARIQGWKRFRVQSGYEFRAVLELGYNICNKSPNLETFRVFLMQNGLLFSTFGDVLLFPSP